MKRDKLINLALKIWALSIFTYFVYSYNKNVYRELLMYREPIGKYVEVTSYNSVGLEVKILNTTTGEVHTEFWL